MHYRLTYLQQINPDTRLQTVQVPLHNDLPSQYCAALLQAAVEAHLNQCKKISNLAGQEPKRNIS